MSLVTFSPFELLFDDPAHRKLLLAIFLRVGVADLDACVRVCHSWRAFIGTFMARKGSPWRAALVKAKLPHEWLHSWPRVHRIPIAKTLAPPLKIYADRHEILLTTIDSLLVWGRRSRAFKGEFGPDLDSSNHVMMRTLSFNSQIMVSVHKHTNILLVWNRRNYRIIQEVPCIGMEGQDSNALYVKVLDSQVIVWLEDGSIHLYDVRKDGTLERSRVLNGHIEGNHDADILDLDLLTASTDSKVNLWDLSSGKLKWSNQRSQARYRLARLSPSHAVVAGAYDQDGYLQIYCRRTGDLLHEMVSLDGNGVHGLLVSQDKIVYLLSIRHKLLTSKVLVLDIHNGDIIAERTFVDVLSMNLVYGRALTLINNQVGDFRTRISVFDLDLMHAALDESNEHVVFQYAHNYWKLPAHLDATSIVHTSEGKADLYVRDFDGFFRQFDADRGGLGGLGGIGYDGSGRKPTRALTAAERRRRIGGSQLCFRLRRILFKKICAKCSVQ